MRHRSRRSRLGRVSGPAFASSLLLCIATLAASAEAADPPEGSPRAASDKRQTPEVAEETTQDGEKSYKFQAVEVEGRMKTPQILYFLRRVRAELRPGRLGHRSFLPELGDTRRNAALR